MQKDSERIDDSDRTQKDLVRFCRIRIRKDFDGKINIPKDSDIASDGLDSQRFR